MKSTPTTPTTIDEYIEGFPSDVRKVLARIRKTIRTAAPAAQERISYRMPAFKLDRDIAYFAAFKNHIGFYPPVRDAALQKEVAKYAGPKGNLQFPLEEPIPYGLIGKIVKARVKERRATKTRAKAKRSRATH